MSTLEQATVEYIARTPATQVFDNFYQIVGADPLKLGPEQREQYAVALIAGRAYGKCIATGTPVPSSEQLQTAVADTISDVLTGWVAHGPFSRKISITDIELGDEPNIDATLLECLIAYHYRNDQNAMVRVADSLATSDAMVQLPSEVIEDLRRREGRPKRGERTIP